MAETPLDAKAEFKPFATPKEFKKRVPDLVHVPEGRVRG
jgi:hypothetical protein